MPKLTKRFIHLCRNEPVHIRHQLNKKTTASQESVIDEKLIKKVFDVDDPEVFRDGTAEYLSYANTEVTRLLSPSFFQAGNIRGLDEWMVEDLEIEAPHDEFGNLSLMTKKTKIKNHRKVNSCQFIVSLKPNPWMNKYFRCIGRVIHGHYVLNVIKDVPTLKEAPLRLISVIDCGVLYSPKIDENISDDEDVSNEHDKKIIKEYEELVNHYYNEMCEIQGALNDRVVEKEILYSYNVQECDEFSIGNESDTDSELMLYDQLQLLDQENPLTMRYNLNVHRSIVITEDLGHKLYQYMCPTLLETLLPEEMHLKEPLVVEGHDFMLQCELASESSEEWLEFSGIDLTEEEKNIDEEIEMEVETLEDEDQLGEWMAEELESTEHISIESNMTASISTDSDQIEINKINQAESIVSSVSMDLETSTDSEDQVKSASSESSEHGVDTEFNYEESQQLEHEEPEKIYIEEESYKLPDYVTPAYLLEQRQDQNKIPRQILEYIFKCVYKHRKHVRLDEETISIMQTDTFKSALATLPAEILRDIARKMDGIDLELAEMERTVTSEEEWKKHNDVISNAVVEFTTNMIEFLLNEIIDNVVPTGRVNLEEELNDVLPESPTLDEEEGSLESLSNEYDIFNDDLPFQL